MTSEEISDMFLMVQKVQCVMEKIHQATSSSIVVQDGKDAGQTIKRLENRGATIMLSDSINCLNFSLWSMAGVGVGIGFFERSISSPSSSEDALKSKEKKESGGWEAGLGKSCKESPLVQWRFLKERRIHKDIVLLQPRVFNEPDTAMPALSERLTRE
nr:unnamed protein product [Timema monikensis]